MREVRSVLVVEDIADTLAWLKACVAQTFPEAAISDATTHSEARTLAARSFARAKSHGPRAHFDLALIDIGLPDGDGVELVETFVRENPDGLPIVTTVYDDDEHIVRAIEAGAGGYLLKLHETDKFVALLKRIHDGEPPLSPSIARRIMATMQGRAAKPALPDEIALTPRELEVLALLGRGFQLGQVAKQLGMAQNTASSHVKSIYRKLNISSRAEAALAAVQRGLIDGGAARPDGR